MLALLCAFTLYSQEFSQPVVVKYSHPTLTRVNRLVTSQKYKQAIVLSLEQARQMKGNQDWEGYMTFMLRAAEIETFEVWKTRGWKNSDLQVDYHRALSYVDSLQNNAGKFLNDYPGIKANTLFTKAVIYSWLNVPDEALALHLQALELRAKIYGLNSREVADSYQWLGFLYNWGLLRRDIAKQYFLKALELNKKYMPESRYKLGSTYYGLSIIARENFDLDEAEAMGKEYSSLYFDLPYERALAYQLFANIYRVQGNFEKALELRLACIKIHNESSHTEDLIIEYGDLSEDYVNLGRYDDARGALKKGLQVLNDSRNKDPFYVRVLYEKIGNLYMTMQKSDSAEYFYYKALNVVKNNFGEHNEDIAAIYGSLGNLLVTRQQYKDGLEDLQKMLSSVIPDFNPSDIFVIPAVQNENPYYLTIITASFNKGDAFLAWYNQDNDTKKLELALDNYKIAYQQLIVARKKIGDEISKPILMKNFEKSIERSIQCASKLYSITDDKNFFQDIFHFVELTKYMNVLDALYRAERADNSGIPKTLIVELDDIKDRLADIQKRIMSAQTDKDSLTKLNNVSLDLIQRRRELMAEVTSYPAYNIPNMDSVLLTIDDIQHYLSAEEQILEYYWGTDSVYILSINNQSTDIRSVPRTKKVDNLLLQAYSFVSGQPSYTEADVKKYSTVTSSLFSIFLKPLITKKKLIIIPDGSLNLLSIEALATNNDPESKLYSTLDYLIYHNEIVYAYSASILFRNYSTETKKIENVLAFSYSNGTEAPKFAQRGGQAELPGAFKEIEALSRLFKNVKRFVNTEASKTNFLNNASNYDIIHLAVHGIGDQEVADNSRLIFRGDSSGGSEPLYAYEIYNLKLDAELIVLSACESGIGRNQGGEGMFSIARAFTYAGCPSLIISRWQVNDTFTSDLMTGFYENLNKHQSTSSALRHAKLQFLKEADGFIAHPANWAAFVVNGRDLTIRGKSGYTYLIFIAVLFLTLSITAYLKRDSIIALFRKWHGR